MPQDEDTRVLQAGSGQEQVAGEDMSEPSSYTEEITEKVKQNAKAWVSTWDHRRRVDNAAALDASSNNAWAAIVQGSVKKWLKQIQEADFEETDAQSRVNVKIAALEAALVSQTNAMNEMKTVLAALAAKG